MSTNLNSTVQSCVCSLECRSTALGSLDSPFNYPVYTGRSVSIIIESVIGLYITENHHFTNRAVVH